MYEAISSFAGTWGLVLLILLFAAAVIYALWPGNRAKFDRAKRLPLEDDTDRSESDSETRQ